MVTKKPVELRRDPDDPNRAAYKTGSGVTAGAWFVFHADHGGGYTDGKSEGIDDWPVA